MALKAAALLLSILHVAQATVEVTIYPDGDFEEEFDYDQA